MSRPCSTAAAVLRPARCGASLDPVCAAAAAGNRRAAFNLGQLYESGEGVPSNADLARAWYAAAGLLGRARTHWRGQVAGESLGCLLFGRRSRFFPWKTSAIELCSQQVDLVWTSAVEPEAVRYFVELRVLDAGAARRGLERICRRE